MVIERINVFLANAFRRRPKQCESCGNPTKFTHFLDETHHGSVDAPRHYLCLTCLGTSLSDYFANFRSRCLMAEPVAKMNAFNAFALGPQELRRRSEYRNHWDLRNVVPHGMDNNEALQGGQRALARLLDRVSGTCSNCGEAPSQFLWLPSDNFDLGDLVLDLQEIEKADPDAAPLCGPCTLQWLVRAIEELNLRLDSLDPPFEDTVVMHSTES